MRKQTGDTSDKCQCIFVAGYGYVHYCDTLEAREIGRRPDVTGKVKPVKLTLTHKQWASRLTGYKRPHRPGHTRKTGGVSGRQRRERVRERSLDNHTHSRGNRK